MRIPLPSRRTPADRKSTRLNSSHTVISYAVFCLKKKKKKSYQHYTGYPGGLRSEDFRERFARRPEMVVENAIKRMLPKSQLGRQMISKRKIYRVDKHPDEAQKPETRKLAVRA